MQRVDTRFRGQRRRKQQGVSLVLMALLLTSICGMAAMAVDVGVLYTSKNSAQNAADAAALAGAFTYMTPQASASAALTAAQNAAVAMAKQNSILGQAVTITAADVTVTPPDNSPGTHDVTVTVPRLGANGIPAFFASVLGFSKTNLVATATAEYTGIASGSSNLRPLFIPNTILSSESPTQACTDGQVILDSSGNLTAWAQSQIGALESIRPTSPSGALMPSQFYSLDFGGGASTYSCALATDNLASCGVSPSVVACGSTYMTKNGNMVGPTNTGVSNLVGPNPDTWVAPGAYQHADGSITDTSVALITAPVWDNCHSSVKSGKSPVTMVGFSNWFVEGMSSGNMMANFVNAAGCPGTGGVCPVGGPSVPNAGFGTAVRLVTPAGN